MPCIRCKAGQDRLRFCHCPHFAERNVPREVIEAAGAGDNRLFGREPSMRFDPIHHLLSGLDIGGLDDPTLRKIPWPQTAWDRRR